MRLVFFLLIGTLSVFFTEVFAGSSPLWFIDLWGILMVFPLYFMHLIFFLNIAVRTKRTSVGHLYLFGVLIGLYESWITKVLWAGYPGADAPLMGTFLGIAILEFSVLVFFWHPVFAFVLPILIFEALSLSIEAGREHRERILPNHASSLKQNRKLLIFLTFALLLGAGFLSINTSHNIVIADLAILGNLTIIFFFFLMARKQSNDFSINSLLLKKKGLVIVGIYLILLYFLSFLFLIPERIPESPLPVFVIVGFYAFITFLIKVSPVHKESRIETNTTDEILSTKAFSSFCLLHLLLTSVFCIIPQIGLAVALTLNMILFIGGPFFFIYVVARTFKTRKKKISGTNHLRFSPSQEPFQ